MSALSELPRRLGFHDAVAIVVGVTIGGGIFLTPGMVAKSLPSPGWILGIWMFGGLLSFLGALAASELGAMIPATGGQYVFLREAYGPGVAFLSGWSSILISHSAAVAWLGVSFAMYLKQFVPLSWWGEKLIAILVVAIFGAVNYRGVRFGAGVQLLFTGAKLAALAVLIASAFFTRAPLPAAQPVTAFSWSAAGVALIACLLSYDGWASLSFMAGELRDPQRNVLRAFAAGVLTCMVVYLAVNLAYLRVFSVSEFASTERIGAALAGRTMGPAGGTFVAVAILISIAGSMNGWLMTQPRGYFAQARDGLFFRRFAGIHPRFETPGFAVAMMSLWASVLIATGSFEILASYAMFSMWLFYGLMVAGVVVLRIRRPDAVRPYRMWGYPVTPALFVLVAAWFCINTAIEQPGPSISALAIILSGIPAYWFWSRAGRRSESLPIPAIET